MSFQQPPPPPPQSPYQQPPYPVPPPSTPTPGWTRKRVLVPVAALILVVGIVIGSAGDGGTEKTSADPAPTVTKTVDATAESVAEPAPTVTVTETAEAETAPKKEEAPAAPEGKAVFKVWGSAPSGVDITYGSDGTNLEGSRLPMTKTLTVDEDSLYYQVSAQLMGGGDVQCSVTINGETKKGRAKGGYNICSAQLNSDFSGGFS